MKAIRIVFLFMVVSITTTVMAQNKKVMYQCNFDCPSCEDKVMKNIPYEKGVKAVNVFYGNNLVTVEFKESKNSATGIQEALVKLGYNTQIMGNPISFTVKGNCRMCKEKIEKAAKSVNGVSIALWNADKQELTITFNNNETELNKVHQAIADSGYDTELIKADDSVYEKLHHCCKYER